jgi:apolipoprotein N-acyltransferase
MCFGGYTWIADMAHRFWRVPWPVAGLLLLLYSSFGELNFMLFAVLLWWVRRPLTRWPAALCAALFTAVELAVPKIFPDTLGCTQVDVPALPAAAALVGTHGLSFLMAWFAACLAGSWAPGPVRRRQVAELGLCIATAAGLCVWGAVHQRTVDARPPAATLRVAIVQSNIGDASELGERYGGFSAAVDSVVSTYVRMSREALAVEPADLLVWPETAIPVQPSHPRFRPAVLFVRATGVQLVFGGYDFEPIGDGRWRGYNTMFWMDRGGRVRGRYYKHTLLVLGEYTPYADRFPFLQHVLPRAGDFTPGPGPGHFDMEGIGITPLICYEVLFPRYVRRGVHLGGQVLLNITDDYWFGKYAEPEQHLVLARMRAFETGRPIVRATNTGISAVIDANARVVARAGLWQPQVLRASLAVPPVHETLYLRAGEWCLAVFAALACGLAAILWKMLR